MGIQKFKLIQMDEEAIWEKELKRILNRDVHNKDLGCCVKNTHMKIDKIHSGEFYEAQFLFGNAYWSSIFSNALVKELHSNILDNVLFVGYETYIEPVLLRVISLLNKKDINYCIYEEPKFILKNQKSQIRLRMSGKKDINDYKYYIIVCGISSTLGTFEKIIKKISQDTKISEENIKNISKCYSIIQVIPKDCCEENDSLIWYNLSDAQDDKLVYNVHKHSAYNSKSNIISNFLISIEAEWENALECKWCYDQNKERPIVTTNDTSVIPVQMIGSTYKKTNSSKTRRDKKLPKINFFQKRKNIGFMYSKYLYYNHIERDSHHYQYYIRTNALLKAILEDKSELKKFDNFCNTIKNEYLKIPFEKERIDIIVVPSHYSNEHFCNVINKKIFNSSAEIINFDPEKEFRSNFETKYSNYAYVLETLKNDSGKQVYFHYVDDQIITGSTFYRARSFINSLIRNSSLKLNEEEINAHVHLFESIIVLIDRNSDSTKKNYIDNLDNYFSSIDIDVPSLRNHGDSCPLCKKSLEAKEIKENSALCWMYDYWYEKELYHCVKTIEEAKEIKNCQDEEISKRQFRRFYCENIIWKHLKHIWDTDAIYIKTLNLIKNEIDNLDIEMQYEYLISFIKVMSKPLIYYRENIKKAVHSIMLYLIHIMNCNIKISPATMIDILVNAGCNNRESIIMYIEEKTTQQDICDDSKDVYKKYYLYIILLSRISAINSNYILKYENIEKARKVFRELFSSEKPENIKHIDDYIRIWVKTLTNGISGKYKAKYLDSQLKSTDITTKNQSLIQSLYIENLEAESYINKSNLNFAHNLSVKEKYKDILMQMSNKNIGILVRFPNGSNGIWFTLAEKFEDDSLLLECISYAQNKLNIREDYEFINSKYAFIKCIESEGKDEFNSSIFVYIVIGMNESNLFSQLDYIRHTLAYRYLLHCSLKDDINSGAIREAYNDEEFVKIMTHPKAVTHGQNEDIKEYIHLLESTFQNYLDIHSDIHLNIVERSLTLFGNLIISLLFNKKKCNERKVTYQFDLQLELVTIYNEKKKLHEIEYKPKIDFSVANDLVEEKCVDAFFERFLLYVNCIRKKYPNIEFEYEDALKEKDKIIGLIGMLSVNTHPAWFSIALIHILVKNAMRHGDNSQIITIGIAKSNSSKAYSLIIKNALLPNTNRHHQGITVETLRYAFNKSDFDIEFLNDDNTYTVIINNFMTEGNL